MLPLNLSGVFPMFTYPGGFDPSAFSEPFSSAYPTHLQHLKRKGLQPKTIDAYARISTAQPRPRAQWKCVCCGGTMVVVRRRIAPVMAAPPPKTRTQSTNQ
jgi:hypothetical protein